MKLARILAALLLALAAILVAQPAQATGGGHGHTPVAICHNGHGITVDDDAVPAHLEHGDNVGECVTDEPTEQPTDEPTDEPTEEPTDEPTEEPTPTDEPTETPVATETPAETPSTPAVVAEVADAVPGAPAAAQRAQLASTGPTDPIMWALAAGITAGGIALLKLARRRSTR